ncbi:hypothetical protein CK203_090869 [Vitis vinifera]|uniref:Uncharacterized protein n=1 Tax=Vitis vinifera TaxID=29760 RepID=A0A438CMW9_VITVI|nr:hypothetical protein CK203_090869 [Vitis vinifera]
MVRRVAKAFKAWCPKPLLVGSHRSSACYMGELVKFTYEPIQACQLMEELFGRVKQGFWMITGLNFKWKHEHKQWRRGNRVKKTAAVFFHTFGALPEFLKYGCYVMAWMQSHGNFSHLEVISYELLESEVFNSKFCINPLEPISMAIERAVLSVWVFRAVLSVWRSEPSSIFHSAFRAAVSIWRSDPRAITFFIWCSEPSHFSFSVQSHRSLSIWRSGPLFVFHFGIQSRSFLLAFRAIVHAPFWRSEPLFRLAFRAIVHFPFGVQSHICTLAFRAVIHSQFDVQSRSLISTSSSITIFPPSLAFRAIFVVELRDKPGGDTCKVDLHAVKRSVANCMMWDLFCREILRGNEREGGFPLLVGRSFGERFFFWERCFIRGQVEREDILEEHRSLVSHLKGISKRVFAGEKHFQFAPVSVFPHKREKTEWNSKTSRKNESRSWKNLRRSSQLAFAIFLLGTGITIVTDLLSKYPERCFVKESTRIKGRRCRKDFVFGGENCLEEEHRGRDWQHASSSRLKPSNISQRLVLPVCTSTGYSTWSVVISPWIAKKAKFLVIPENSRIRNKFRGKEFESASVTIVKDLGGDGRRWIRECLWDELGAVRGLWGDPWCVEGDFNVILAQGERSRQGRVTPAMRRFENMWLKVEGFKDLLRSWWQGMSQVDYWDLVESERSLSEEEFSRKKEAKEGYAKWVKLEEIHWRQLSRELWLREGNKNTGCLSSVINGRLGVETLELPFMEEEVHSALMDMNGDKAPGPDGFTGAFWQFCWEFVKEEVLEMFKEFHEHNVFLKSLNTTFLVLIPKK